MRIYPAIDMKDGRCVRLLQGRAEDVTVYGDDPAEMALRWANLGAKRLHLVDLDGAFTGHGANSEAVQRIRAAVPHMQLQLGGGIRTLENVRRWLELGIDRVILGTMAAREPETAAQAAKEFPGRIIAGIDAKDGMVAVHGWTEKTDIPAVELGKYLFEQGIRECVYTDISRDGMLSGPNLAALKYMREHTGMDIIASGGMSSLEDLALCSNIGCGGAIVGKAMYDGKIDIQEAIARFEGGKEE